VTQVSTLPSGNYRQRQRNQADERLAALALRALGIWRDSWIQAARRAWGSGAGFLVWVEPLMPNRDPGKRVSSPQGGDIPVDRMQSRAWQPDSSFVTPRWSGFELSVPLG